jgi:sugar phosphate isomerase/epimerase
MERIGLENLTVIGETPPRVIELAAEAGCRHVALYADLMPGVIDRPYYSLVDDAALRRETVARMRALGVDIALLDAFPVMPGSDHAALRPTFDILGELAVKRINTVSMDHDGERAFDQTAAIVETAKDYGVEITIEPCPGLWIETIDQALALIARIGAPHFKLLIDTMHIARAGTTADDLARIDPALFGYIQISDSPMIAQSPGDYIAAALTDRLVPGDGVLPLVELIAALPADLIVSAEVPMRRLDAAGVPVAERVAMALAGTRDVLARADARRGAAIA